jgi:glycosyltransferase involved in cell wall biosynthesis
MKIGYDVSQTGKLKAGCGYLAYSLGQALSEFDTQNEYFLFPTFGDFYLDPDWPKDTLQVNRPNFQRGSSQRNLEEAQKFWRNPSADFEQRLGNPDIIHANNFYCPTQLKRARLVYTLYDLGHIQNPDWTTEANRVGCFEGTFNASLHADFIVAISDYSRRHFLNVFPHYPSSRMAVVPLASRFAGQPVPAQPEALGYLKPGQFWLNVATIEPRKNPRRLAQAYARLKAEVGATYPLVLAGGRGWLMEDFEDYLIELGIREDVHLLGYVDDSTVIWLLKNCFALVYPSLFEGFGLPVLEAMSQGAAVITSNTTSIPEVIGDAGLLIDPMDVESIYQAMRQLYQGEIDRSSLQTRGLERSKLFSWQSSARQVMSIYEQVMGMEKL